MFRQQQNSPAALPLSQQRSSNGGFTTVRLADNSSLQRGVQLPMLTFLASTEVSFEGMKQILSELSAPQQLHRLATDASFLRQQAGNIHSAVTHLQNICFNRPQECRQLLEKEPQLLKQLLTLTTAALQQLAAQGDNEVEVSRTAAVLADTLAWMLGMVRDRPSEDPVAPSSPADAAKLQMMKAAGACLGSCTSTCSPCLLVLHDNKRGQCLNNDAMHGPCSLSPW